MTAKDGFWLKGVDAFRSLTMEVVTAIVALTSLSALLTALPMSIVCTSLTAGELWPILLSVSAAPAILVGSERRRSGQPVSALLCDIDGFHDLNDRYGHEAGDGALRKLAEVLEESVERRSAVLGRQGGDEFVILLPGIEGLCETCEARALVQQERAAKFTISVGVGTETSGAPLLGGLLRQTDAALYRAKRAAGNQVGVGGQGGLSGASQLGNNFGRSKRFENRTSRV